jgi:hypothetical protein
MTNYFNRLEMAGVAVAFLGWPPNLAHVGPPLIADDPNTVGPGVVQPIFAVSAFSQGDETLVLGPTADVTIRLVDSLDATLIATLASLHDVTGNPRWTLSGLLAMGAKWEFFRRKRGSLCFSPAFVIDTAEPKRSGILLPVQGELAVGRGKAVVGFDVGYVVQQRQGHQWFVALCMNWTATRRLNVLGELWAVSFGQTGPTELGEPIGTDFGTSIGIDYGIIGNELRLLAAVGTGIVSLSAGRIDIRAYLGTQFTFGTRRDRWRSTRP